MNKDLFKKLSEVIKAQNELLQALKNELIDNNGYDYVDLDLPSGTLWATCNVGAKNPSNYGLYFQWGDTKGYKAKQVGEDKQFTWCDYKLSINGNYRKFNKYTTRGNKLELEDDAAHVHMGGGWHIPTAEQLQELIDNTTTSWTTSDGVSGMAFTSKKDTSKSIFIPAAGNAWDGSVNSSGNNGYIWSSLLNTVGVYYGQLLDFHLGGVILRSSYRYLGLSVRGVIG